MLQDGRFPPWRFPRGSDATSETYTTIRNPHAAAGSKVTRSTGDDGASSPVKPFVTPNMAQVIISDFT